LAEKTTLRRVASLPNASDYFTQGNTESHTQSTPVSPRSSSIKSSYSLEKQQVEVGPEDFEKVRLLGRGDAGRVYLVKQKQTEKLYALKGKHTTP
jgi:hypothetical protein